MTRRIAPLIAVVAVAVVAVGPAEAKHRKPITKTFAVTATVAFPAGNGMCDVAPHGKDRHIETFQAPEAGTLEVKVTGFVGDYDMVLLDDKRKEVAQSNNETGTSNLQPSTGSGVETLKYKIKKAMKLYIHVCNFLASPNASGTYTFTYAR